MSPRWRATAALLLSAALIGGCSDGGSADQDKGPTTAEEKAELDKQIEASGAPPATAKDKFMPVLQSEYDKVEWPDKYVMTTDGLWQKLGGDSNDIMLTPSDATSMVTIWNMCAWSLQLIDDTKAGKSTKDDVEQLTALGKGDMKQAADAIVGDARLGGLSTATQFVEANDCKKGFA